MHIFLAGLLLGIIAVYLRIRPRLFQNNFGIDSWYYLLCADEMRKQRKLPLHLPYFLLDINEQWYPPALPVLLRLFPQKFLEKYHWLFSAFIDSIQMLTLYIISYFLTKNIFFSFIAGLLYATSPILVTQNSNLNTRGLGALFLILTMLALYWHVSTQIPLSIVLILLLGALVLHTHKLASQQMVILFLGFCFLYFSLKFLFILLGIFLFAFLLSGGFYLKILRGHIGILKFWKKNLANYFVHQIYKSPLYINEAKAKSCSGCGGLAANKLWYILTKLQFIFIFLVILMYYFLNRKNLGSYDLFFLNWAFINFISIVMVSYFGPLKFIGEGHRYFMYGIFPVSFLVSRYIFSGPINLICILILAIILISNLFLINKIHLEQKKNLLAIMDADFSEIIKQIKVLPRNNIMCFPFSYSEPVVYFCRKKVLWGAHSCGYDKLEPYFPVLLRPVEYFINQYKISYCLINKDYVSLADLHLSTNYKILIDKGRYSLLEFINNG